MARYFSRPHYPLHNDAATSAVSPLPSLRRAREALPRQQGRDLNLGNFVFGFQRLEWTLGDIVVYLHSTIMRVTTQRFSAIERVIKRGSEFRF